MRTELKYHIKKDRVPQLKVSLVRNSFFQSFDKRNVNSLYFDDLKQNAFHDNIEGNLQRVKKRFRWYDNLSDNNSVFLEVKKKNDINGEKIKNKIIVGKGNIVNHDFIMLLNDKINFLFNVKYTPMVISSYSREYFENIEGIRVTIDTNLRFINPKSFHKKTFEYDILEIKFPKDSSPNLCFLKNLDTLLTKNSKYAIGVDKLYFNKT
tara:strand:- start:658 stop:1281 length:624 start_codon:yes stop_codon:yes gene_type:complete